MRFFLVGAIFLLAAGCTEPRSERCKSTCEREARCAESADDEEVRFDQQECVSACAALERDAEGKLYVDRHIACVSKAASCGEVISCQFKYQEAR